MAAARNVSRKGRQRSQDLAESLINLSNERLTGLFRWTLLIFAVILNNLNAAPGYDVGRINGILAAWGVVCLTTLLLLFLHQRPGRAFSYTTTAVDMLVATMITYASGGYTSPFAILFFLVITVSALRFGAAASVLCALLVAVLYLTAGAVAPLENGTYLATVSDERIIILQRLFLFVVVAVVGSVMAQAVSSHQEIVTRRDVEAKLMTEVNMALANAIEAKDSYTRGHSERLAKLAGACAARMGLTPDEVGAVKLGAILHDVGKIGIPDRILRQSMAMEEIRVGSGTHFDPKVVEVFVDMIDHDTVHLPLPTLEEGQKPIPARP